MAMLSRAILALAVGLRSQLPAPRVVFKPAPQPLDWRVKQLERM